MRNQVATTNFPNQPGVYVLYETINSERPLYVGMAATESISERWRKYHVKNRAGGSALRRSLGPHLDLVGRKLSVARDGRYYPDDVEQAITEALLSYFVEWHPTDTGDEAAALESDSSDSSNLCSTSSVKSGGEHG